MKRLEWIAALLFVLVVSISGQTPTTATPQTATQKPDQPAIEQPADFKAFNEASKTSDPKKRIEAFQKFMADYPASDLVYNAGLEIRSQYLRSAADSTKQYLSEADKYQKTSKSPAVMTYYMLASELLRGGVLLDQAEEFAIKGLAAEDEAKYVQAARERAKTAAAERKQRPPSGGIRLSNIGGQVTATLMPPRTDAASSTPREQTDDDLRAQYRSQRAQLQNTLAQIYLKRGKNAEAEKLFKEVYANAAVTSSAKAVAVRQLADFARKAGDDKALLQYLIESVVAGARPDVHTELHEAYRKTHGGSLDGLESTLDAMYEKSLPKIDVRPFDRPKTREPRVVLAELFTGSECPPCVGIDLAFEAALERFKPEDLAFLVYHQHIPGPDPMTNPSTEKRLKFYNVRGVPTHYIDGKTDGAGGGGADAAAGYYATRIKPGIELAMAVHPEAKLDVKASTVGSTIRVKASLANVTSKSDKLRLHIVLAEERLRYHGSNGIRFHPMVVRSVAGVPVKAAAAPKQATGEAAAPTAEQGFAVPRGKGLKVDYVFDLAKIAAENRTFIDDFLTKPFRGGDKPKFSSRTDEVDPRHLVIVAFVQDEDPKQGGGETTANGKPARDAVTLRHVLQAASVRLGSGKTTN
jgi:TfoX/Sxy family transcriptional regulator of competence genes